MRTWRTNAATAIRPAKPAAAAPAVEKKAVPGEELEKLDRPVPKKVIKKPVDRPVVQKKVIKKPVPVEDETEKV